MTLAVWNNNAVYSKDLRRILSHIGRFIEDTESDHRVFKAILSTQVRGFLRFKIISLF